MRIVLLFFIFLIIPLETAGASDYPSISIVNPRVAIWLLAQLHLWFAAFILAIPIFAFIMEFAGVLKKDARADRVAREFITIATTAFSITAVLGIIFTIVLFLFYPKLTHYMTKVFKPTFLPYLALFLIENALLYGYCYSWNRLKHGGDKWVHLAIGFFLNLSGTLIMFIANAWTTFMMTPKGVDANGVFTAGVWDAITNPLWGALNLHRFTANVAFGASCVASYAAYRFLSGLEEEKAHYDWMGYTANLISIIALLPLPFAGYWLTKEIFLYSEEMGMRLMGGIFGWLFIVQSVIIGAIFLSANYYLWCGMQRSQGAARYNQYIKYIAFALGLSFLVWFTPHNPVVTPSELKAIGSEYHPITSPLGLMPAKNIAINIMILSTFLTFLVSRRVNSIIAVSWKDYATIVEGVILAVASLNIIFVGVYYGYFTDTAYKVASSAAQVATTLVAIIIVMTIDIFLLRGAKPIAPIRWGSIPARSQYALIFLTVSFTWLMGLMGFIRSAIRKDWHIYGVMKDTSTEAFTPTIQYATKVVSIGTIIFMAAIVFIFWLNRPTGEKYEKHG